MKTTTVIFTSVLLLSAITGTASDTDVLGFGWRPSPETNITSYRLYFGQSSNAYTHMSEVSGAQTNTQVTITNAGTWYFVVTARNAAGLESVPSNMVTWNVTNRPAALTLTNTFAIVTRSTTVTTTTNIILVR